MKTYTRNFGVQFTGSDTKLKTCEKGGSYSFLKILNDATHGVWAASCNTWGVGSKLSRSVDVVKGLVVVVVVVDCWVLSLLGYCRTSHRIQMSRVSCSQTSRYQTSLVSRRVVITTGDVYKSVELHSKDGSVLLRSTPYVLSLWSCLYGNVSMLLSLSCHYILVSINGLGQYPFGSTSGQSPRLISMW